MVWVETIIAAQTNINAETDNLAAIDGCSLTTRTGYGKPKITHALAFCDTDDVQRVWVLPSGFMDPNGFEIPTISTYAATNNPSLRAAKLPVPVEVPENCALQISAQSETAANSRVEVWLLLQYPKASPAFDGQVPMGGMVKRAWEHGAALVSNTPANSTNINDLQAGRKYKLVGVGKAAVNGATAGLVGPAYFGFQPNHTDGAIYWLPLVNGAGYSTAGLGDSWLDLMALGIPAPMIQGGQPLLTRCAGFTAEQPQAELNFVVDKVMAI